MSELNAVDSDVAILANFFSKQYVMLFNDDISFFPYEPFPHLLALPRIQSMLQWYTHFHKSLLRQDNVLLS